MADHFFSDPEDRSPEEYEAEVESYLRRCRSRLDAHALWRYVRSNDGLLGLVIVNPTDRNFEGVKVVVRIDSNVVAVDPDEVREPPDALPAPPRPFGTRKPKAGYGAGFFGPRVTNAASVPPVVLAPRPNIDNSHSATTEYPPVHLRPRAGERLGDITLIIREPPQTDIIGTWSATATNAEGQTEGNSACEWARTRLTSNACSMTFERALTAVCGNPSTRLTPAGAPGEVDPWQ